jgi:hypothetical protein
MLSRQFIGKRRIGTLVASLHSTIPIPLFLTVDFGILSWEVAAIMVAL